ncbi:hypothetical protein VC4260B_11120 [Vibrio cholerae 4260B]|nr:hypothetical protein VCHC23A1_1580 [Vibrio cholerae HC-23A1]EHI06386.1 hypothetical protein VCHC48B2_1617 [Vibrio cholerae HC-48B2]EJH34851.1 hypothetical protein VCCP103811_2333 [Vibrio cholerae CP1038(11)]EJH40968.1 hypothetical protein VCCP104215_2488 [Vibrio cholerae CP1042(15)]EJH46994.1 hypothetical protein VCCP104821_1483 [Vibrio cholerae CP1048(21)]EJH54824.1 hypothetical protein VCHC20A2_1561 [Vibrio cholerae HC-20A2]EJH84454.1 hypothetical protein VCCP10303_1496 [Vibrio cholerae 
MGEPKPKSNWCDVVVLGSQLMAEAVTDGERKSNVKNSRK